MIAILEDDGERAAAMTRVLAALGRPVVFHDDAAAMNAWLDVHIDRCVLISLDHDLGPSRQVNGERFDPGVGRDVVDLLAAARARAHASCRVIVHSSNGSAAVGMVLALEAAGWRVERVVPMDGNMWIDGAWANAVHDALLASSG